MPFLAGGSHSPRIDLHGPSRSRSDFPFVLMECMHCCTEEPRQESASSLFEGNQICISFRGIPQVDQMFVMPRSVTGDEWIQPEWFC